MIPRSKLARRVATNARRTALAGGRHYATPADENGRAVARDDQSKPPRRIREKEANAAVRAVQRRIQKAETDERMDITAALTEVKTYMGGFTEPQQLRTANWWPGGPYEVRKRNYEPPSPVAYTPHTVFIAESRYPIRHEIGRPDTVEQFVGVCREEDFPAVMARLNSERAPEDTMEMMDNARWPWGPQKRVPRVKWLDRDETHEEIMRKIDELDHTEAFDAVVDAEHGAAMSEAKWTKLEAKLAAAKAAAERPVPKMKYQGKRTYAPRRPVRATELLMPQRPSGRAEQRRVFHFSMHPCAENGDPSKPPEGPGSFEMRRQIPGSTWARPHKPSQDADDDVVPSYYVERKRQRSEVAERKEEEGSLMAELNAGILSEGLAAETKVREEKIPVEVRMPEEGLVIHPSGFEPPTPETHFHPAVAKKPTEDHPLVGTLKQRWDDLPATDAVPPRPNYDEGVETDFSRRKYMRDQAELDAAEVLTNPDVVTHPAGTQAEPSLAGAVSQLGPQAASTGGQRSQIPASSWDTPERQTVLTRRQREENTRDDVVPTYYIERKRQRSSIAERKEEEGGLMSELNAGILSEGLAADMRVREEKIPVEVRIPHEGTVRHPSGFEPPTPETEFHPTAAKVATEDHPVIATKKIQWHDSEIIRGANGNGNGNGNGKGNTSTSSSGARGLHTSAVLRALAVSDSTFGFMSPSVMRSPAPARDASLPQPPRQATRQQDAFKLDEDDEVDVNAVGNPAAANAAVQQVRSEYLPTLAETPFWRPLLSVTLQTRPLATTVARLSRAYARGTPFYSTVDPHDRKYGPSMGGRVRNMRLNRTHELVVDLARLLRGERGGPLGIRWNPESLGRGIKGEGMAEPIPLEKRMIKVGLGEWYKHAEEWKAIYADAAREAEVDDAMEVFGIDQRGARTDGKEWPKQARDENAPAVDLEEHIARRHPGVVLSKMGRLEQEAFRVKHMLEHTKEIAAARAQARHPAVLTP